MGRLLIITGASGAGKDSVMHGLIEKYGWKRIVSYTTRAIRNGEVDGTDYNFVSGQEFSAIFDQGEFLETMDYAGVGDRYGTTKVAFAPIFQGKNIIWRIDAERAGKVRELFIQKYPELLSHTVVVYIKTPTWEELLRRTSEQRVEAREKRLKKDKEDFEKFKDKYDFVVDNPYGKLDQTVEKVQNLVEA